MTDPKKRLVYRPTWKNGEGLMKKEKMTLGWLGTLLLLCVIASQAGAQSFVLSKLADRSTPIPGGTGNFAGGGPAAISGGNIAFLGNEGTGQEGI
jgi:hypothetical protein